MLKDAIVVKRGKAVKIILEEGPMSVMAMGVSEQDGVLGEVIRVRNTASNKMVYARVVSDSTALLKF
jgi:flagella basal body P-ring formation protein FlgA